VHWVTRTQENTSLLTILCRRKAGHPQAWVKALYPQTLRRVTARVETDGRDETSKFFQGDQADRPTRRPPRQQRQRRPQANINGTACPPAPTVFGVAVRMGHAFSFPYCGRRPVDALAAPGSVRALTGPPHPVSAMTIGMTYKKDAQG